MIISIDLNWKSFSVNLYKVQTYLKTNLSSNYDGLVCDESLMKVIFKSDYSNEDYTIVTDYWNSVTQATFTPTAQEVISVKIQKAMVFGQNMIIQAATTNVIDGITQAGKTKQISDYLQNLVRYLREGSLYAAMAEIDVLIDSGVPTDIQTWINTTKLASAKANIQAFLAS